MTWYYPFERLACVLGLHAWFYYGEWQGERRNRSRRVCATCPMKQRKLLGRWVAADIVLPDFGLSHGRFGWKTEARRK